MRSEIVVMIKCNSMIRLASTVQVDAVFDDRLTSILLKALLAN